MRTEQILVGTKSELLEYFGSLNIKEKDFVGIPPYNKEQKPILEQFEEIDKKYPKVGIIFWLHFEPDGNSLNGMVEHITISMEKQFVLVLDISDEEMQKEFSK